MTGKLPEQQTVAGEARLCGVGLHSGEEVELVLGPAPANTGVVFVRVDLPGEPRVEACVSNVVQRPRRTALARGPVEIHTTEHLMAALWAAKVDNVEVRLNRPELPGMDGSALPFYQAIREAGIKSLGKPARELRLREPLAVDGNGARVTASPSANGLKVAYTLDFRATRLPSAQRLGSQFLELEMDEDVFVKEIAPARTFVLKEEVEALQREGLGQGANTQNTVVFGEDGVIDGELRFPDECVRHKILDLLGDLCLIGRRFHGHVVAARSGHFLNVQLARRILEATAREGEVQDILSDVEGGLDSRQIERLLPHRYPFLLVDRILSVDGDRRAVGLKNVTYNEEFFRGHFPGRPLMPGVLQLEALAQLAGVLLLRKPENVHKLALLMSLDRVKFRNPVVPGDQLILQADLKKQRKNTAQVETIARVNDSVACEARMRYMLVDP